MNSVNIKNITNQAIEQLIEALKAGKSEALTNYLAAVAKFHRYSFQNILLIARQLPAGYTRGWLHTFLPFRAIIPLPFRRTAFKDPARPPASTRLGKSNAQKVRYSH